MKIVFSALFLICSCSIFSQESENGRNMVTNYKGIDIGFVYPKLTYNSNQISLIESQFSWGVRTGFHWGRIYKSGLSVSFSPSIIYVSVPHTVHKFSYKSKPEERTIEYQNVSWAFPVMLETPFFFNGRMGAGLSIVMPILSTGKYKDFDIDLSFLPEKGDNLFPRRDKPYPRLSFFLRYTLPLFQTEARQNFISFEYLHYTDYNQQTHSQEKLFSLTFMHRQWQTKEKRFKWDRAILRQDRSN